MRQEYAKVELKLPMKLLIKAMYEAFGLCGLGLTLLVFGAFPQSSFS